MDRQQVLSELVEIIGNYLKIQHLDLVDLIYRYEGKDLFLRILVDKPQGGISLDECADLNNGISKILDEKDIMGQKYILEVSSPGLDRTLKTKSDFSRCINRRVRFFLSQSVKGKVELEGIITQVTDDSVNVDIEGAVVEIPLLNINRAKQIIR